MSKYRAQRKWYCPECSSETTRKICDVCGGSDCEKFDSKSELKRYRELLVLEYAGQISDLKRQVPFPLSAGHNPVLIRSPRYRNGRQVKYVADFTYTENGETIVEDRKGVWTADAKLKVAFFEAQYGTRVRITGAGAKRVSPDVGAAA